MKDYIEFQDVLAKHIENRYSSVVEASKKLEINRTTLTKIINGQRSFSDVDDVKRVGKKLMLTTDEFADFIKLYKISKMGMDVYKRRNKVQQIIKDISNSRINETVKLKSDELTLNKLSGEICINSKYELNKYIRTIIYSEFNLGSDICIIAQPSEELNSIIYSCTYTNEKNKIKHYFCMDNNFSKESFNENNLDIIYNTVVLALSRTNYYPMFYYDNVKAHINVNSILPYVIITEHYTIAFDSSMCNGIVYKNEEICRFYKQLVLNLEKNCDALFTEINDYRDLLDFYSDNLKIEYEYGYQPCILCAAEDDIVENHIALPEFAKKEYMYNRKKHITQYFNRKPFDIFCEKGLIDFVEKGVIYEIPDDFYTVLTPYERNEILKNIVKLISDDEINYRICREDIFKGSKVLLISGGENFIRIILNKSENNQPVHIKINEPGTVFAFNDYFQYLIDENFIYSKKETIEIIKKYIK